MTTFTLTFRRSWRGFTLIELLIAVAIVGILTAVAYPAYNQSVRKSRRADAKTALLDLAQREERYMSTANTYSKTASDLGYPSGTSFPIAVVSGSQSYYSMTVSAADASTFAATATPTGDQLKDKCGSFTIKQDGSQTIGGTGVTAANCW